MICSFIRADIRPNKIARRRIYLAQQVGAQTKRHNARKVSVLRAFCANAILYSIGSVFFQSIEPHLLLLLRPSSVTYVLNLLCYLCPEPAPAMPVNSSMAEGRAEPARRGGFRPFFCRGSRWLPEGSA